jgi:hypothetical protein
MRKRYTIRYYNLKKQPVITSISTYIELSELMKGDAKNSIIETKMSENMSQAMHNEIGRHNHEVEKENPPPHGNTQ